MNKILAGWHTTHSLSRVFNKVRCDKAKNFIKNLSLSIRWKKKKRDCIFYSIFYLSINIYMYVYLCLYITIVDQALWKLANQLKSFRLNYSFMHIRPDFDERKMKCNFNANPQLFLLAVLFWIFLFVFHWMEWNLLWLHWQLF